MEQEYEIRRKIIEKLDDLKEKIETNEDFPEAKQDIGSLVYIDDAIQEILNSWYY